ncbi:hypothetical protein Tsubulata_027879 [Turnera subulata]|uniref:ABC transporter domain-containing protein n=1 Tax=Turnera subulata TaxID=218843 RepID=A0A9Q0FUL8_9ROSI|nr:hypothetical protein Tsubulata_027879 [Turnera subulata]
MEVSISSSKGGEEEPAKNCSAIEKQPTCDHLREDVQIQSVGGARENANGSLGSQENNNLLERLLKLVEEDNGKFLLKLKDRFDRVGVNFPTVEVRFEHLNVEIQASTASQALPTFPNFFVNILGGVLNYLHIPPSKKKHLSVLKDASGIIRPSRMTLLLGPPSSGKTTLLLALAGKLDPKMKSSGTVTYNGHMMNEFVPQRTAAYISQNDLHLGQLTVRETLEFSARCQGSGFLHEMLIELFRREKEANIRHDSDIEVIMQAVATASLEANVITNYVLKMFIEEVMQLVELTPLKQALVGLPCVNGLSIEQRKRLTIAVELVANPSIIFMDEPTSGLDARAAAIVMRTIRNMVDTGRTVVCTIHQPSIDIFEAFDELFLLKQGGQAIYVGPLGHHSSLLINYFEGLGASKIRAGQNPATWMLEVTSFAQEKALGIDFASIYKNSEPYRDKLQDLFNAMGLLYASVLFLGVQNMLTVQPLVTVERIVFYREKAAGMYPAFPYAIAQRIPVWWRWYYWACPVAWTLYGLLASQYGDVKTTLETGHTVEEFLRVYFGFKLDFLNTVAIVVVGWTVLFAFAFAVSIKLFNFQRR